MEIAELRSGPVFIIIQSSNETAHKKQIKQQKHFKKEFLKGGAKMADWLNLEGKVVIVTGGASGIGNHVVS
ncbi:MAG: hypothetical protein Q4C16_11445, partial [Eubacteriales bacterium]|nr:hypothetical protein [Eubacteriales bacterium]